MYQLTENFAPRRVAEDTGLEYGTEAFTVCNSESEVLECLPRRWDLEKRDRESAKREIARCAELLARGVDAVCNLYMRICDQIRDHELTDGEIRGLLSRHFPPPRVSEFIRVANAPRETYMRYRAGLVGFRAVLQECRGYHILAPEHIHKKKVRRAAERLLTLMGDRREVEILGHRIRID